MLQRDAKEKRREGEERKQETERHTQGTEPTPQHRLTQNAAKVSLCLRSAPLSTLTTAVPSPLLYTHPHPDKHYTVSLSKVGTIANMKYFVTQL
jgi:hypothetical protein